MSYEVGSGTLLDNLDDAVVGLSAGESGAFTTTPGVGDLEGEAVDVTVTVTAVRERELPDVDDDFAQLVSEFDTLDELKAAVREELNPRKGTASDAQALLCALNTASVQLVPATVIALRAGAGSAAPAEVLGPTLAASLCGVTVAVIAAKLLARVWPSGEGGGPGGRSDP